MGAESLELLRTFHWTIYNMLVLSKKTTRFYTIMIFQYDTPDILEYQLRLGRQRQVWLIPIADERVGVQVKL